MEEKQGLFGEFRQDSPDAKPRQSGRNLVCYQVRTFIITYLAYAAFHSTRETWSYLKEDLNPAHFSNSKLGAIDSSFLFPYSIGQFVFGAMGDRFSQRWILGCAYFIVAFSCAMTSFGYQWSITGG